MICDSGAFPMPVPSQAEQAEIARLRERFHGHHIFCETMVGRGVRYIAHSALSGARPHTIITDDLTELRVVLEQASLSGLALRVFVGYIQPAVSRHPALRTAEALGEPTWQRNGAA